MVPIKPLLLAALALWCVGCCEDRISPELNRVILLQQDRIDRLVDDSVTLVLCDAAYDAMGARVDKLMADSVWIDRHKCLTPRERESLLREANEAWGIPQDTTHPGGAK